MPVVAMLPCFSMRAAAAPACMAHTAVRGAASGAATDSAASRSACGAATSAPCASSSPSQQCTHWRHWQLSSRQRLPFSAATQLNVGTGAGWLRVTSAAAGVPDPALAHRTASSGPAADAASAAKDIVGPENEQEPSWRRPSEPQRPWDQPSDKRRLLVYYSDHYEVVSWAAVRGSCRVLLRS